MSYLKLALGIAVASLVATGCGKEAIRPLVEQEQQAEIIVSGKKPGKQVNSIKDKSKSQFKGWAKKVKERLLVSKYTQTNYSKNGKRDHKTTNFYSREALLGTVVITLDGKAYVISIQLVGEKEFRTGGNIDHILSENELSKMEIHEKLNAVEKYELGYRIEFHDVTSTNPDDPYKAGGTVGTQDGDNN